WIEDARLVSLLQSGEGAVRMPNEFRGPRSVHGDALSVSGFVNEARAAPVDRMIVDPSAALSSFWNILLTSSVSWTSNPQNIGQGRVRGQVEELPLGPSPPGERRGLAGERVHDIVCSASPGLAPSASLSRVQTFMLTTIPMISRISSCEKCSASAS